MLKLPHRLQKFINSCELYKIIIKVWCSSFCNLAIWYKTVKLRNDVLMQKEWYMYMYYIFQITKCWRGHGGWKKSRQWLDHRESRWKDISQNSLYCTHGQSCQYSGQAGRNHRLYTTSGHFQLYEALSKSQKESHR